MGNSYEDENGNYSFLASITQKGHKLNGSLTITKSVENKDANNNNKGYVLVFDLTGNTWEGFVLVNLQSKSRKTLSFASGLFKVKERGQSLVGHLVFRGSDYDEVTTEPAEWRRETNRS